jgi:hypothetical protein
MCFFGRCLPCLLNLAQFFVDLGFDSALRINKSRSCLSQALPTFWVILITVLQELSIPLATRVSTLDPLAGLPWNPPWNRNYLGDLLLFLMFALHFESQAVVRVLLL